MGLWARKLVSDYSPWVESDDLLSGVSEKEENAEKNGNGDGNGNGDVVEGLLSLGRPQWA